MNKNIIFFTFFLNLPALIFTASNKQVVTINSADGALKRDIFRLRALLGQTEGLTCSTTRRFVPANPAIIHGHPLSTGTGAESNPEPTQALTLQQFLVAQYAALTAPKEPVSSLPISRNAVSNTPLPQVSHRRQVPPQPKTT